MHLSAFGRGSLKGSGVNAGETSGFACFPGFIDLWQQSSTHCRVTLALEPELALRPGLANVGSENVFVD